MKHEFKPADLRIGDVVMYHSPDLGDMPCRIEWQHLWELSMDPQRFNEFHSPIELTKDLLIKIENQSHYCAVILSRYKLFLFTYGFEKSFYLHGFQYFFRLLTNTELDVSFLFNQKS